MVDLRGFPVSDEFNSDRYTFCVILDRNEIFEIPNYWFSKIGHVTPEDMEMSGVALAFRATLSPKTTLSTVPGESRSSHWRLPIFRLKQTVAVKASRQYRLDFSLTPGEESFCVSPI